MATATTDQNDVRTYVKARILKKWESLSAFAEEVGAQRSHVSAFLNGAKPVPDWALEMFRIKKEVVFTIPTPAAKK